MTLKNLSITKGHFYYTLKSGFMKMNISNFFFIYSILQVTKSCGRISFIITDKDADEVTQGQEPSARKRYLTPIGREEGLRADQLPISHIPARMQLPRFTYQTSRMSYHTTDGREGLQESSTNFLTLFWPSRLIRLATNSQKDFLQHSVCKSITKRRYLLFSLKFLYYSLMK